MSAVDVKAIYALRVATGAAETSPDRRAPGPGAYTRPPPSGGLAAPLAACWFRESSYQTSLSPWLLTGEGGLPFPVP